MPQKRPFPPNTKALSPSLQPSTLRNLSFLHLFGNPQIRQRPDWFVGFRFTAASKADRIEDVICTLDIIHGLPGGGLVTNKNRVAKHNQPISFTRGYEADLYFKTKFTAQPIEWKNCRVGRRFSVDGEVFRIIKVTPDLVQLVSDQGYGGNRQIYDKPFRPGPNQVRPGLNIPVPGGGTNAVPVRPPAANTNAPARPIAPPRKNNVGQRHSPLRPWHNFLDAPNDATAFQSLGVAAEAQYLKRLQAALTPSRENPATP